MKLIREHRFITILLIAALISAALVFYALAKGTDKGAESETDSIEETIYDRALQCYVIEGAYPESLSYLEENYGLTLNRKDYLIVYTPFADNLPPEIKVIYRGDDR